MAYTAIREALIGGDLDAWGTYEQSQNHLMIGTHTSKLYLSGATLYVSKGKTGLYDDTQYYALLNAAAVSISLAGLTTTCWAKVELSVVAGIVVVGITSIAGQTNPNVLPTAFTGAFDETKGGYYITNTKRCIGVVWITAAGACDGIVNVYGNNDNYQGYAVNNLFSSISGKREWQIELTTGASLGTYIPPTIVGNTGLKITLGKYDSGAGEACFDPSSLAENCIYLGNTVAKMYDGLQGQHTTFEARSDGWHLIRGIIQPVAGEPDIGGGWHSRNIDILPGGLNLTDTNWHEITATNVLPGGVSLIKVYGYCNANGVRDFQISNANAGNVYGYGIVSAANGYGVIYGSWMLSSTRSFWIKAIAQPIGIGLLHVSQYAIGPL